MSIDYGQGRTNIDHETGIRYGVISQHSISQAWCDSAEGDYGPATCPQCGFEARDVAGAQGVSFGEFEQFQNSGCADYACERCEITFDSGEAFPDTTTDYSYEGDGYTMTSCLDSDVMVLKSPFYTFAPFCSPCVPGAGNLDDAGHRFRFVPYDISEEIEEFERMIRVSRWPRAYAVGHDWFDPPIAPYPVYGIVSGRLCFPDEWYCTSWEYRNEGAFKRT